MLPLEDALMFLLIYAFISFDFFLLYRTLFGASKYKLEWLGYFAFYLAVSAEYICVGIPLITTFINIIGFFLLTLLYDASWRKRLLCSIFSYAMFGTVETVILGFTGYLGRSLLQRVENIPYLKMTIMPLVQFIFVLIFRRLYGKRTGEGKDVPTSYWFAVFLTPVSCVFGTVLLHTILSINFLQLITMEAILFIVTIGVFIVYEKQLDFYNDMGEQAVTKQQLHDYKKSIELQNKANREAHAIRHDMKNHLIALNKMSEDGDLEALRSYLQKLTEEYQEPEGK